MPRQNISTRPKSILRNLKSRNIVNLFFFTNDLFLLGDEKRFVILITELRIIKNFWFTHLEDGRKGQGCSYWHWIGRNDRFGGGRVKGSFLEVGEGRKILFSFLDNTLLGEGRPGESSCKKIF